MEYDVNRYPNKKLSDKTEFLAVDFFRLIFALGIVALHLSPLLEVNKILNYFLVQVLTRLGVPFFFLTSGFFVQKKLGDLERVKAYVFRLVRLYLLYTLLYLPQIIYGYIKGDGMFVQNILVFMRDFFLVGSYTQLWYFVGLIVAVLLLYLLVNKLKLSDKRGCGQFIGLIRNPHIASEFCWTQSAERQLNTLIPIPNHVLFNLLHEIFQGDTLPRTTIEHLVLHPPEKSLTS